MQQEEVSDMSLVIVSDLSKAGKKEPFKLSFLCSYVSPITYVYGKVDYKKCNIAKHYA